LTFQICARRQATVSKLQTLPESYTNLDASRDATPTIRNRWRRIEVAADLAASLVAAVDEVLPAIGPNPGIRKAFFRPGLGCQNLAFDFGRRRRTSGAAYQG